MKTLLREILNEVRENSKRLGCVERNIVVLQNDVSILKEDVAVLKEDVTGLKEDVAGLKEDVTVLKEDVAGLKEDVAVLKVDVKANRQMLTGMERRLTERIDAIGNKNAANTQELRNLKNQLEHQDKIDRKWANDTIKRIDAV